jgi:alkylation response protein AidB-like acyl-CoA dehydrogenase
MDLSFGPEYESFREEVRAFLEASWPPPPADAELPREEQEARFRDRAIERGYMYRSIPKAYGGSEQPLDALREAIITEEFDRASAPWRLGGQGVGMIVPTLLEVGADWQRTKFIPPTLRGDMVWCQGYSEPGAGSDLASLRSTARLEGDEWVIDGHKIWTSDATDAHFMFGLFRTEPDAPKHGGISYLLLDMHQPGIEVRPLRQLTGASEFCEVFLDGARTPADWIVGGRGDGWKVTRVNLKHERNLGGGPAMRKLFQALVRLANRKRIGDRPALQDPFVRRRLAEIECIVRCVETTYMRQLSRAADDDEQALPDQSARPYLPAGLRSDRAERDARPGSRGPGQLPGAHRDRHRLARAVPLRPGWGDRRRLLEHPAQRDRRARPGTPPRHPPALVKRPRPPDAGAPVAPVLRMRGRGAGRSPHRPDSGCPRLDGLPVLQADQPRGCT